ncbi:MAG TPA: N-acetyl-gamma-glutamyl-phosphate reductase [Gemmatimonadaceae bacterium]|nr:N-acetyl-gamma-glutamyl-phosphate reductase [Gemmatimonadaceae bacterium]
MHKFSIGVLGASGYTGRELCGLVARHPSMELAFASASSQAGSTLQLGKREITFIDSEDAALGEADLVFSALPHGASAMWSERASAAGAKVVDLSSDLRPGNSHANGAPYGLTELMREQVKCANTVANPGCYPTAILIALAPLFKRKLTLPGSTISITAASGVTGAGYTPKPELLFAEIAEDYRAYSLGNNHRHLAEMRAVMNDMNADNDLLFIPHLLPVARGILATITVALSQPIADPLRLWEEDYADEPFIEVTKEAPSIRDVVRRNVVRVSAINASGVRQPTLTLTSAIDNLVKGAAGQAVQNANLMLGIPETTGLPV